MTLSDEMKCPRCKGPGEFVVHVWGGGEHVIRWCDDCGKAYSKVDKAWRDEHKRGSL